MPLGSATPPIRPTPVPRYQNEPPRFLFRANPRPFLRAALARSAGRIRDAAGYYCGPLRTRHIDARPEPEPASLYHGRRFGSVSAIGMACLELPIPLAFPMGLLFFDLSPVQALIFTAQT
jgi:hypothetical protein